MAQDGSGANGLGSGPSADAARLLPTLHTWMASPLGPILLVSNGDALTGLYLEGSRHAPKVDLSWRQDDRWFDPVREQLEAYFAGDQRTFSLPLAPAGTEFQRRVWTVLRAIPYGDTMSYGGLAALVGNSRASRAVGLANGRNPISIIIPCHRVIGHNGALTGYGSGIEKKAWLLRHERAGGATLPERLG